MSCKNTSGVTPVSDIVEHEINTRTAQLMVRESVHEAYQAMKISVVNPEELQAIDREIQKLDRTISMDKRVIEILTKKLEEYVKFEKTSEE